VTGTGAPVPPTRLTLRAVPGEPEQVPRLHQLRHDHPDVAIVAGTGWWQARIPEPDGELVITRYTLRELLDKLDQLTAIPPGGSTG